MRVSSSELLGALKAARLFASEDVTTPSKNCVHLEVSTSALRIVATDGHTLWCCEISATDTPEDPPLAMAVAWDMPLSDVDELLRALVPGVEVNVLLSKRTIESKVFGPSAGPFPPYQNVLAYSVPPKCSSTPPDLAPEYIVRACEAFKHYGKGFAPEVPKKGTREEKDAIRVARQGFLSPSVSWRTGGEMDPAFFFSPKFPVAFALVMPRRAYDRKATAFETFFDRVRGNKSKAA